MHRRKHAVLSLLAVLAMLLTTAAPALAQDPQPQPLPDGSSRIFAPLVSSGAQQVVRLQTTENVTVTGSGVSLDLAQNSYADTTSALSLNNSAILQGAGPLMVAEQLPDSNPIKKVALDFFAKLSPAYPQVRNAFSGYSYDAFLLVQAAVTPAMAKAKAGTPQFRQALRDALEGSKEVVGTHGVLNFKPGTRYGADERARVMVKLERGQWKLLP